MLTKIIKFFASLFRKKPVPVVEPEKKIIEKEIPEEKDTGVRQQEYNKHEQKLARRRANRLRKKLEKRRSEKRTQPNINKHGIPILTKADTDNLSEHFTGKKPETENFAESLEKSLSGKTARILLMEKTDEVQPDLSASEKIKMYPNPEDELDLHGYTAREAAVKTESFIRNARHRGLLTLRIIVGKGLHSQGRAVLPDVIENKIAYLKKEKFVLTFQWEKRAKLRSGAIIVYLAKRETRNAKRET
ncbi:Smr/MutS family protein [Desulfococcaceae bacterium HSG8]|nr:Smr/MutS family protein [Desulfococcaceae bacterium HSG8]